MYSGERNGGAAFNLFVQNGFEEFVTFLKIAREHCVSIVWSGDSSLQATTFSKDVLPNLLFVKG